MIAPRVLSEEQLQKELRALGFEPTDEVTETGRFWKNSQTGKHVQVPHPLDGHYPNWMLTELNRQIGRINRIWN